MLTSIYNPKSGQLNLPYLDKSIPITEEPLSEIELLQRQTIMTKKSSIKKKDKSY